MVSGQCPVASKISVVFVIPVSRSSLTTAHWPLLTAPCSYSFFPTPKYTMYRIERFSKLCHFHMREEVPPAVKLIASIWPYILVAVAVTGFLYQFILARP